MQTLISTAGLPPSQRFKRWREAVAERMLPVEMTKTDERPFVGKLEAANVGSLLITRLTQSAVRIETDRTSSHHRDDTLSVAIMLSGTRNLELDGRKSIQREGDFVVMNRRPATLATQATKTRLATSQSLVIVVPRVRFEQMLGPPKHYVGLTVGANQGSTALATAFFNKLIRVYTRLDAVSIERISSIGVDLLIASVSERLAQDLPKSLHGTVVLQRAKAYIEANLCDPTLDPPRLAVIMGISLRRLQQLFHECGLHISDWIWTRRLEVAAMRLNDPGCRNLSIGLLAHGCGFSNQAHFSRRFKNRYGITPTEYRHLTGLKY